jgi:lipopolysaccharide export system permease protein
MTLFQRYMYGQLLWPFLATLAALSGLAVLTQSLSNLDLIAERGETALAFVWITVLAMPQVVALLLPVAVFIACAIALTRMVGDSEMIVGASAGMSRRERLTPVIRLALWIVLANLVINLFVQPASFRQMRELLYEIRTDIAASFMREGEFIALGDSVTFYVREIGEDGVMNQVFIEDGRAESSSAYAARRGVIAQTDRGPVMLLENGVLTQVNEAGALSRLSFERYEFGLTSFVDTTTAFVFKDSDKFLPELLDPSATDIARARGSSELYAEGHYRLASPLYNLAFALIAAAAFFGVQHRRTGYTRFLIIAGSAALVLRLAGFAVQAAASSDPALNALQYALPLGGSLFAVALIVAPSLPRRRQALDGAAA